MKVPERYNYHAVTSRIVCLCLLAGLCLMSGCTRVQKFSAGAGLLGAAVGGTWAHHAGQLSTAEGALVGLAAGGLAGALVGDALGEQGCAECENLQQQLAAKDELLDKLRDQLAQMDKENEGLRKQLKDRDKTIADLRKRIKELESAGGEGPKPFTITLAYENLFDSGSAVIKPGGKKFLAKVTKELKTNFRRNKVIIEGHTDTDPIKSTKHLYKSNWELGAARALAILNYLAANGVSPSRLSAQTFGEYQPRATNATSAGKQKNRRAVVVIWPTTKVQQRELNLK